ncbi:hypothetical protein ACFVMC_32855 [Nocardia sp. NPDC127579]|uniref:hypothetical protein n=1 Tax=Nocardia sp. NPDC127579 TaxID=3345402 RepID=UPI0036253BC3
MLGRNKRAWCEICAEQVDAEHWRRHLSAAEAADVASVLSTPMSAAAAPAGPVRRWASFQARKIRATWNGLRRGLEL